MQSIAQLDSDHPRACGENAGGFTGADAINGSPPRMRGKLAEVSDLVFRSRITPAHAGKTFLSSDLHFSQADHPRACGENGRLLLFRLGLCGSPPRMRGKPLLCGASSPHIRITPAHAGKTLLPPTNNRYLTDHPRACGENLSSSTPNALISGSPPRMRGKQNTLTLKRFPCRITPAHAGKTSSANSRTRASSDHPRACGENLYRLFM